MNYYHDLITARSWQEMLDLVKHIHFVLIGGWAAYLYTKALKSKDIDIIVDFDQLALLRQKYNVVKNERLQKYEARRDEVQIDVYLPHYSSLGVPIEEVMRQTKNIDGFNVPTPEYLILLKLHVHSKRMHSTKGHKDFLDLVSLLSTGNYDVNQLYGGIKKHHLQNAWLLFTTELNSTTRIPELALNPHALAKLKRKLL